MWHADTILVPARPPGLFRPRTAAEAIQILGKGLVDSATEILRLAHLDSAGRLIALAEQHGGHDALPIAFGQIVRDACHHHTRQLLVAHNHPSGDPKPSNSDRLATRRLAELLRILDIVVLDHLIFARGGIASFRAMGLL